MFSLQFYSYSFCLYYLATLGLSACTPPLQPSHDDSTQSTQEMKSKSKPVAPVRHHTFFTQAMGTRFTITLVSQDQISAHNMAKIAFKEFKALICWSADSILVTT